MLFEKVKENIAKKVYNQLLSPFNNVGERAVLRMQLVKEGIIPKRDTLDKVIAEKAYNYIMQWDIRNYKTLAKYNPLINKYTKVELTDKGWELLR
jgi:hypothetical protein